MGLDKLGDAFLEPFLLAAIMREESRYDARATSAASARGLTQFVFSTAVPLAEELGMPPIQPEDLYRPEIAIELGAAYLAKLSARYNGRLAPLIAAYNAGESQSDLWTQYCVSTDDEEYFAKIAFNETRAYVARVLRSLVFYRELYGEERPA